MSFKLIQTHAAGGDCTAPYKVELDSPYTVGEFIKEVLMKCSNEWGDFEVRTAGGWFHPTIFRVEYKYGKLMENIPEEIASLSIVKASSCGGWTAMDYNIIVND